MSTASPKRRSPGVSTATTSPGEAPRRANRGVGPTAPCPLCAAASVGDLSALGEPSRSRTAKRACHPWALSWPESVRSTAGQISTGAARRAAQASPKRVASARKSYEVGGARVTSRGVTSGSALTATSWPSMLRRCCVVNDSGGISTLTSLERHGLARQPEASRELFGRQCLFFCEGRWRHRAAHHSYEAAVTPSLATAQGDQLDAGRARGIQEGLP